MIDQPYLRLIKYVLWGLVGGIVVVLLIAMARAEPPRIDCDYTPQHVIDVAEGRGINAVRIKNMRLFDAILSEMTQGEWQTAPAKEGVLWMLPKPVVLPNGRYTENVIFYYNENRCILADWLGSIPDSLLEDAMIKYLEQEEAGENHGNKS
jgi:hypothetical protein